MAMTPAVQTCWWGKPTLFLPWPLWYAASQHEWSCTRGSIPITLVNPAICRTCPYWAPRTHHPHETHSVRMPGHCQYRRALVRRDEADEHVTT